MRIVVGISGASGVIYGWALLKYLHQTGHEVHAVVTDTGWKVLEHECGIGRRDIAVECCQITGCRSGIRRSRLIVGKEPDSS